MLVINDARFAKRAEIIWEKGTNRAEFFRGEVNKYGWVDTGSPFLPSEIISAFLFAQLEQLKVIQSRRIKLWQYYYQQLSPLAKEGYFVLPSLPAYVSYNAHMFYIKCKSVEERQNLIEALKNRGILAVFHYLSLHQSSYYKIKHDGRYFPNADFFSDCLLRLPLFYELSFEDIDLIVEAITEVVVMTGGKL